MTSLQTKQTAVERYQGLFGVFASRLNGQRDSQFFPLREKAMSSFSEIGFPDRKNEDYKYTNLTHLLSVPFQTLSANGDQSTNVPGILEKSYKIYFLNGRLNAVKSDLDHLPDQVRILTIAQALRDKSLAEKVSQTLHNISDEKVSAFTLLSVAFAQGMVFQINKDASLALPIQLIYESNIAEENVMLAQLNLFFIEAGAKCNVVEVANGSSTQKSYFQNIYNRIQVGQNAQIIMHRWQEEGDNGHSINTTEVKQSEGSTFSNLTIDIGGKLVRNNVYATHLGEQVTTNLYGAYIASGERQHIDNQTFIDHAKPHCLSNELYKGIVDNYSKAVFNGKVIVRPDAQKINAFQQNASLLLSDKARVDSKPQLEIFADDVKCSHGATIGQLDGQALYYLMTRGIPKREAEKMLQAAFIAEVFSDFGEGQIVDAFSEKLQQYL